MEGSEGSQEANTSPTQQLDGLEPSPHCHRCPPFKISLSQHKNMHGVFNRRKHHHAQQRISNLVIATLQVQRNGNKKHKQRAVPKSPASSLQGHHGRHTYVTYVTIFHKIMIDWGWLRCIKPFPRPFPKLVKSRFSSSHNKATNKATARPRP